MGNNANTNITLDSLGMNGSNVLLEGRKIGWLKEGIGRVFCKVDGGKVEIVATVQDAIDFLFENAREA